MALVVYNRFKMGLLQGDYDLSSTGDTIKVSLHTSSYTPNQDTHEDFADVTNQLSGTGYTAGGNALSGKSVTQDNTDNEGVFDATDVTWSSINAGTAAGHILYKDTGTPGTSLLMFYDDTGGYPVTTTGADLVIQWDSEGIINIG